VIVNPLMVIQLREEIVNPCEAPVTVTVAPGAARKVIGRPGAPDFAGVTFSW
jgi:hypothetical protein